MSKRPDVVILGGGVIGCAVAYYLSKEGIKPLLVEQVALGNRASGVAAGFLAPLAESDHPGPLLDLCLLGLDTHRQLAEELRALTGVDVHYVQTPVIRPAFSTADAEGQRHKLSWQQRLDPQVRWIDGDDARHLEPRLSNHAIGALLSTHEAQLESYRLVQAYAKGAVRNGLEIKYGTALEIKGTGQQVSSILLKNEEIFCDTVVLAMGPWTRTITTWTHFLAPLIPLKGQLCHVNVTGQPLQCALFMGGNYALPKPGGHIIMGTTEEHAGFDIGTTPEALNLIFDQVSLMAPSLADATLIKQLAGLRPLSVDGLPIIGLLPFTKGLFIATGHGRKGILLSAITGRIIADLIMGRDTPISVTPFSPDRFLNNRV